MLSLVFRGTASHCFVQRLGYIRQTRERGMLVMLHRLDMCNTNALSTSTSLRSGTIQQKTTLRFPSPLVLRTFWTVPAPQKIILLLYSHPHLYFQIILPKFNSPPYVHYAEFLHRHMQCRKSSKDCTDRAYSE